MAFGVDPIDFDRAEPTQGEAQRGVQIWLTFVMVLATMCTFYAILSAHRLP